MNFFSFMSNLSKTLFFLFILLSYLHLPTGLAASELATLLEKIQNRQGDWIFLEADLDIHFASASTDKQSSCQAKLTYHRLDEKMMLQCFDESQQLRFSLQTSDRVYKLYLPDQKTVFQGDMLELENSEKTDSSLRPLLFLRALKTMAIPRNAVSIDSSSRGMTALHIEGEIEGTHYVKRTLEVNEAGDVFHERFYAPDGSMTSEVQRESFQPAMAGIIKTALYYPERIRMISMQKSNGNVEEKITVLIFKKVRFPQIIEPDRFNQIVPNDTKRITLSGDYLPSFR